MRLGNSGVGTPGAVNFPIHFKSYFVLMSCFRIANPVIHLCNHFRSERLLLTGPDSKACALVHEGTHFGNRGGLSATDSVYGEEACHALAEDDAHRATGNADNYQFFSEYGYTLPLPT